MDGNSLSRVYLESLATADLIKIADSFGLDIPDNPDRVFIIEELLEASLDNTGDDNLKEKDINDSAIIEPVALPKYYNVSFIQVMVRDPLWAFVFWEIRSSEKEQLEKNHDFSGYYLKVTHLANCSEPSLNVPEEVFRVQVKPEDTAWYLGLTPAEGISWTDQSKFKVELCAGVGDSEIILAGSNPVKLPELSDRVKQQSASGISELVRMSGYGDYRILQRNERQSRTKGFNLPNE